MSSTPRTLWLLLVILGTSDASYGQTPWQWDGQPWADNRPFMTAISPEVKQNLRSILAVGIAESRVAGRMGQIGDSITFSSAYFRGVLLRGPNLNETGHDYDPVRSWLAYSGDQPADGMSFYDNHGKNSDYGNFSGWTVEDAVLEGHPDFGVDVGDGITPGEYSWVLIMFGTNDIDAASWEPRSWGHDIEDLIEGYAGLGVIPVISTIPPEASHQSDGRVEAANRELRRLGRELAIPLVDYYRLVLHHQPSSWHGTLIGPDGTHPSAGGGGRDFSQAGLTNSDGYAARTKLTLDMAEKIKAIVFLDGPAEPMFADDFEAGHLAAWAGLVGEPAP